MKRVYVASKTKHAPIWEGFRARGYPIISGWLDQIKLVGGQSRLWHTIHNDVHLCSGVVLYVAPGDVMKSAMIEVGMALGQNKPIAVILDRIDPEHFESMAGSWLYHPLVIRVATIDDGFDTVLGREWRLWG